MNVLGTWGMNPYIDISHGTTTYVGNGTKCAFVMKNSFRIDQVIPNGNPADLYAVPMILDSTGNCVEPSSLQTNQYSFDLARLYDSMKKGGRFCGYIIVIDNTLGTKFIQHTVQTEGLPELQPTNGLTA